ncbi:MAG: threonine/serine exporter family protein [Lachnospiraceae bacterium]|nr:threonine/serine exporter family protein [Lachnospiraceae bacterium]
MTCVIQLVVAVFATISFAVIFSVPRRDLILCGISGGLTWLVYFVLTANGMGNVFASLIATFILTIMARVLAVTRKNPATVYLLTGIFPLVPGAGIYYTAYYLIQNDRDMFGRTGLNTFEVAAAIVFGIIFGFSIPQRLFNYFGSKKDSLGS